MESLVGRGRGRLQARVEGQLERRQAVMLAAVDIVVLEEDTLAVLGESADTHLTAIAESTADVQLPDGSKITHHAAPLRCCQAFPASGSSAPLYAPGDPHSAKVAGTVEVRSGWLSRTA